ncbi:putative membrane protein [Trachipleistophora hominis]|uniref:Putative membrane protein n=1 Tax=Trachipleistophora hominis TaxID=72359 RepID=L7JT87_TRAHO|nr:putative membrane protein [Trachipleistophora hominis]
MKFSIRHPKGGEFGKKITVADDFILLNFMYNKKDHSVILVGTRANKKSLVTLTLKSSEGESNIPTQIRTWEHALDFRIYHVITNLVDQNAGNVFVIVESVNEERVRMHYLSASTGASRVLCESDIMPLMMTDGEMDPCFLIRDGTHTRVLILRGNAVDNQTVETWGGSALGSIMRDHTSAYVDVDNDSRADVLIDTQEDGERLLLLILTHPSSADKKVQRVRLPEGSGPLIFEDLDRDGKVDLCYVCANSEGNHLIIHFNQYENENDVVFSSETKIRKIDLNEMFPEYDPVMRIADLDNMPGGIFVYDMELKQFPNVVLLMVNKTTGEHNLKIITSVTEKDEGTLFFKKKEKKREIQFEASKYRKVLSLDYKHIVSMSCWDPDSLGREGLLVNAISDGKYELLYYENNLEVNHYKLSLITLDGRKSADGATAYNTPVPGVSYRVSFDNKTLVNNQMTQCTFLNLKKPIVTFGLGSTNLLIEKIRIGIPRAAGVLEVDQKIIPNSDLVFTYRNGKISIELLLKYGFYIQIVFCVLLVVLFLNLLVVLLFTYLERRKKKLAKKKEASAFNFKAL